MILARDPLDELRRAFRLFDTENKGKINIRDLKRVAKELGESLSEDELSVFLIPKIQGFPYSVFPSTDRQAMIDEFDLDQDGEISEQEFIASVLVFSFDSFVLIFIRQQNHGRRYLIRIRGRYYSNSCL